MKNWKMFLFFLFPFSCVQAQENNLSSPNNHQIFLKYNQKSPFLFLGKVDVNKTGGGGAGMLYPGGNALVFFTAVLTHAAIESSIDHSKLSKEQVDANKVLEDYEPYIQKFNVAENLVPSNVNLNSPAGPEKISFLTDSGSKDMAAWEMEVTPIFFMTQNFGSLILYNKVVLQESLPSVGKVKKIKKSAVTKKNTKNEKVVVVISDPIAEPDFRHFWSNNEGARFLATLKGMYKDSMSLIIANKFAGEKSEDHEQVTVKYMEDGVKKVERGYVISANCKRTLFESLSGEIKSVPNLEFLDCPPSA